MVVHDRASCVFESVLESGTAALEYVIEGKNMVISHTFVPPAGRGRGVAEQLVRAALDFARAEGLRIVPRCGYVKAFLDRHPELAGPA